MSLPATDGENWEPKQETIFMPPFPVNLCIILKFPYVKNKNKFTPEVLIYAFATLVVLARSVRG